MALLLTITANEKCEKQIKQVASLAGITVTVAQTYSAAREYLSMESFDAVFVDDSLAGGDATELLVLAWKHNPLLMGALMNLEGPISDPWEAKLYGAQIFAGERALDEIQSALQILPDILKSGSEIKHKIMFVEDLDSPRNIIETYIQMLGYSSIESISRAPEALSKLRQAPGDFFCVLTDIKMPTMSGIELTEEIRKNGKLAHLPVIFLTAVPSQENFIAGLRAGGTGFLVKPPQKRLLRAELEKAQRIFVSRQSPVLCQPEDTYALDELLNTQLRKS